MILRERAIASAGPRLIHNTHRAHLISQFSEFTTRGSLTLPLCAFDFVFLSFFSFRSNFRCYFFFFGFVYCNFIWIKRIRLITFFLFDFDFLVSHRVQIKTILLFFHTKSRMCSNNFPVERKNKQTVEREKREQIKTEEAKKRKNEDK